MAMGYINSKHATRGIQFDVEIIGEFYPAIVQGPPVYDPEGTLMRS